MVALAADAWVYQLVTSFCQVRSFFRAVTRSKSFDPRCHWSPFVVSIPSNRSLALLGCDNAEAKNAANPQS